MADESLVPPRRDEEGVRPPDDPRYPPQSVLRPAVRRSALFSSVGLLVMLAIVLGLGMLYWVFREKGRVDPGSPQAVGTIGTAAGGFGSTVGGGDPAPRPDSVREELERRGAEGGSLGTTPAVQSGPPAAAVTAIGDIVTRSAAGASGQPVDLRGVEVDSGDARSFWIRDGSSRVAVVAGGETQVTPGATVDVTGVTEPDGAGSVRVRAEQVRVR